MEEGGEAGPGSRGGTLGRGKEEAAVLVWRKVHRRMGRRKKESNAAPLSSTRGGRGDDLMTKTCTKSFVVHIGWCVSKIR